METKKLKRDYKIIIGVSLLAFILWFMVKMSRVYDYVLDVPVRYVNMENDRIFKYPSSQNVRIEFTGRGLDLLRLHFYNLYYQVDLSGSPMKYELDLSEHPEYVHFPGDLSVEVKSVVRPRLLVLEMDRKLIEQLPVEVLYRIQTPPGYLLVDAEPEPDSVTVTGPAQMFDTLSTVQTEKKEFSDIGRTFREKFSLKTNTTYYATYNPSWVTAVFDIQRLAEKEVLNVPVNVVNTPSDLQVIPLPSVATIYVKGGERILADLNKKDFDIKIDFKKEWWPGAKKVKANLLTDANVLYMETRPHEFELIVQRTRSD